MAETTKSKVISGQSYTNQNLEDLQKRVDAANADLKKYNTTAASDEDLRARAESELNPTYNAQVGEQEAAKATAKSRLDSTLGSIERQYGRDLESMNEGYDQQAVAANNNMLARGFNNSSLAVAMQNHINTQRNKAQQNLMLERQAGESAAQAAYNDAVTAADAAIARLGVDKAQNIDARYQALREAEQNRVFQEKQAQNALTQYVSDLMVQIESLRQQGYSQYLAEQEAANQLALQQAAQEQANREYADQLALQQAQLKLQQDQAAHDQKIADAELLLAQKEFDARYGGATGGGTGGGSGGSSGRSSGSGTTTPAAAPAPTGGSSLADKYNAAATGSDKVASGAAAGVNAALTAVLGKTKKANAPASLPNYTYDSPQEDAYKQRILLGLR